MIMIMIIIRIILYSYDDYGDSYSIVHSDHSSYAIFIFNMDILSISNFLINSIGLFFSLSIYFKFLILRLGNRNFQKRLKCNFTTGYKWGTAFMYRYHIYLSFHPSIHTNELLYSSSLLA